MVKNKNSRTGDKGKETIILRGKPSLKMRGKTTGESRKHYY
jgi:hypothetical protein